MVGIPSEILPSLSCSLISRHFDVNRRFDHILRGIRKLRDRPCRAILIYFLTTDVRTEPCLGNISHE